MVRFFFINKVNNYNTHEKKNCKHNHVEPSVYSELPVFAIRVRRRRHGFCSNKALIHNYSRLGLLARSLYEK